MTEKLPKRILSLSPSATFEMSRKSSELAAQGIDVINMAVGEPDFNTPQDIKEALLVPNSYYLNLSSVKSYRTHTTPVERP